MRKLLCFVLTLAMVLSMVPSVFAFTTPADAVDVITYTDGAPGTYATTVAGSGEKDANDNGFNIKAATATTAISFGRPTKRNMYVSYNKTTEEVGVSSNEYKYFVFQFNFKPYNNTYFTWTSVGQGGYASYPGASSYLQGQWNKVAVVIDFTDINTTYIKNNFAKIIKDSAIADFANTGTSTADPTHKKEAYSQDVIKMIAPAGYVYVNGKKVSGPYYPTRLREVFGIAYNHWAAGDADDFSTTIRTDNEPKTSRFFLKGGLSADFDDVCMYYTKTDITDADGVAMTSIDFSGAGYTATEDASLNRNLMISSSEVTPAQLKADNPSHYVKVYTDSNKTTELSDSSYLVPGNVVVLRNSVNDAVGTYTVAVATGKYARQLWFSTGDKNWSNYLKSGLGSGMSQASENKRPNASEESSGNYYGKPWTDKSALYTSNNLYQAAAEGETYYRYLDASHSAIGTNGKHNYDYHVIRYEILEKNTNNLQDMYMAASGTTAGEIRDVANHKLSSIDADTYFRPSCDWHKVVVVTDYSKVDTSYEAEAILENSRKGEPIGTGIEKFDKDKVFPVTKTYVDGVLAYTAQPTRLQDRFGMYNTYYNGETKVENEFTNRLRIWYGNKQGVGMWVDNFYMEYYNFLIDGATLSKPLNISAKGFDIVNDGYANVASNEASLGFKTATISREIYGGSFTLAELEAATANKQYTFSAYDNKLFRNAIGKNTPLAEGNLIHVVDNITGTLKNYIVSVKSIAERGDNLIEITDGETYIIDGVKQSGGIRVHQLKLAATKVAGTAGKAATDLGFTFSSTNDTNYSTFLNPIELLYSAKEKTSLTENKSDYTIERNDYKYYVASFNFMPHKSETGNGTGIQIGNLGGTNNISTITPQILMQERWNRVALVYDFTDVDVDYIDNKFETLLKESRTGFTQYAQDIKKKLTPLIKIYINGELVATGMAGRWRDTVGIAMPHYTSATSDMLTAHGSEIRFRITGDRLATLDDVYAYTTSEDIDFEALTALPEITSAGANATAVDNRLVIRPGAALADLAADGEIVVYEGESFASGATLAIRGYNDGVNLYKVSGFNAGASGATATDVLAGNWVVIAEYDANGNMVNCAIDVAEADGTVKAAFETSVTEGNHVRAYLLDGKNTIKPLSTYIVVQ